MAVAADPLPIAAMKVVVNGEAREVPDGVTIRALLEHLFAERGALEEGPVAVEVNRTIVPRADHRVRVLAVGDVIEIVHLVGGG